MSVLSKQDKPQDEEKEDCTGLRIVGVLPTGVCRSPPVSHSLLFQFLQADLFRKLVLEDLSALTSSGLQGTLQRV